MKINKLKSFLFASLMLLGLELQAQSTEDFFYQRGLELGMQKGYERGVADALNAAKEMLKNYDEHLKAYEIGKYLVRSENLTAPQVWQSLNNKGELTLRITPAKIEKEININELFARFLKIPTLNPNEQNETTLSLAEINSTNLSSRDSNINALPQRVDSNAKTITLNIQKTSKNLDILKKANVVFSDEENSYNVLFFSELEKKDFCAQFGICQ